MKNRGVILLVVLLVVVLGGIVFVTLFNQKDVDTNLDELLKINTTLEFEEADLELYNEAKAELEKDSNSYSGLLNLAIIKQRMLDYEGALELYSALAERKTEDIMPRQNAGSIYFDTGDYENAEKMQLDILNNITHKWINSYRELTQIYRWHLKDRRETLKPLLLFAYDNFPESKQEIVSMLGFYYDEFEDNNVEALKYYNELATYIPDDQDLQETLKELNAR